MPFSFRALRAAVGVGILRVAAVDDDVAFFEMRHDLVDHLVDGVARLHHQHHAPWPLQRLNQFFDGVRADDLRALGFVLDEVVNLGNGSIEHGHAEAVVVHVQNQILAHHREADQSDVTICIWHSLLLDEIVRKIDDSATPRSLRHRLSGLHDVFQSEIASPADWHLGAAREDCQPAVLCVGLYFGNVLEVDEK